MIFELLEDFAGALRAAPAGWAGKGPGEFFRFVRSRQDLLAEHPDLTLHWAVNQDTFPAVRQRALVHRQASGADAPWLRTLTRSASERCLLTIVAHPASEQVQDPGKSNKRFESQIWDCKWSPSGQHIASVNRTTVRLWDALTGRLWGEMPGERWCEFSPDGKFLISPIGTSVGVMDTDSGARSHVLKAPSAVGSCLFCPRTGAVIGIGNGVIHLWHDGRYASQVAPGGGILSACAISPDGRRLAVAAGRAVRTWDTETWQSLACSHGLGPISLFGCAFTPDGKTLYVSGLANEFRGMTWALDAETLRKVRQIGPDPKWEGMEMASKPTVRCAVSPDGTRLAAGTGSGGICVWDTSTGRQEDEFPVGADVWGCDYSADGTEIVSGDWSGCVRIWDARPESEALTARRPVGRVLDFGVDGKWAATLTASFAERTGRGEVYRWDLESGAGARVASLSFSMIQGGFLDVSGSVTVARGVVRARVSTSGHSGGGESATVPPPASPPDPHEGASGEDERDSDFDPSAGSTRYLQLIRSPDGKCLAGLSETGWLDVWDVASRSKIHSTPCGPAAVDGTTSTLMLPRLTFLPDGCLCLAEPDGRLTGVDVRTGQRTAIGPATRSGQFTEFSPDGRHCVFVTPTGRQVVEDTRSGARLLEVPHAADCVRGPSLSGDGRFLLAAGPNAVEVWALEAGRPILKTATRAALAACAWALAGTRLLVADAQGAVDIFAVENVPARPPVVTALVPFAPAAAWLTRATAWAERLLGRDRGSVAVFRCPWGSRRVPAPWRALEAIADIRQRAALTPEQSPALHLPAGAFDDPRLLADCPACGGPLKFNPFLVDHPVRPANESRS